MPTEKTRVTRVCERCGRIFRTALPERTRCSACQRIPRKDLSPLAADCAKAREAGLTYGQWRAKEWLKKHPIIEKRENDG